MLLVLKLPAFLLAVYVMYWSLPLANLLLFIKAWKVIGDRNDIFRWCAGYRTFVELAHVIRMAVHMQQMPEHLIRTLPSVLLQVPVSSEGVWHQSSQVRQAGAVQRRCLHVPGELRLTS
jgi:uncharacterized membrane-anchored protein YitT (DUF2179 family)